MIYKTLKMFLQDVTLVMNSQGLKRGGNVEYGDFHDDVSALFVRPGGHFELGELGQWR